MIEWYAVRQKSTGFFLPQIRKGRGFTHDEPKDIKEYPPRLFKNPWSARSALRWWAKGITTSLSAVNPYHDFGGDDSEVLVTKPVPGRDINDMEIVLIQITAVVIP
jgi:hypothetical protein